MKRKSHTAAVIVLAVVVLAVSCTKLRRQDRPDTTVKVNNIIFLIGDGMGLPQINSARVATVGAQGSLNIDRMPAVGFLKTHAVDELITDSAAAGTALACGVKTHNGVIALGPDGEIAESILKAAQKKGLSTGLVATSTITHATPAVFAAHIDSRRKQAEIAEQMLAAKVNVIFGGGKGYFVPRSIEESERRDDTDLLARAGEMGYQIIEKSDLPTVKSPYVLGLFQMGAMTTEAPEPSIAEMTGAAIRLLRGNPKGFFLMVEGSQIDWRSHNNDAEGTVRQMRLFDEAIAKAVAFAQQDAHTLVVVTADHETGGMTINGGNLDGTGLENKWTTLGHTGVDVPIFAFGPGSQEFVGVYDNTEVPRKMAKLLQIKDFPNLETVSINQKRSE